MSANKIILNKEILIDLTADTVTENDVASGITFHKADGTTAVGTKEEKVLIEKEITANGEYPASADGANGFSKVIVDVESSGGECSGEHIIPVDELPTENIDTSAIYNVRIASILMCLNGEIANTAELGMGAVKIVSTRPTENIEDGFYLIEDENVVLFYMTVTANGNSNSAWYTLEELLGVELIYSGEITDLTQAVDGNCYLYYTDNFYRYENGAWANYIVPKGTLEIAENGTKDVTKYSSVTVETPVPFVGRRFFNSTLSSEGLEKGKVYPVEIVFPYGYYADLKIKGIGLGDFTAVNGTKFNCLKFYEIDENGWWKSGTGYDLYNFDDNVFCHNESTINGFYIKSAVPSIQAWFEANTTLKTETTLTEKGTHDIAGYETALVDVAGGECDLEHIIEVDTLPETGEDGATYKVAGVFTDVILQGMLVSGILSEQGGESHCHTVSTKPTENIQASDDDNAIYHWYYIEDENDIFLYVDSEWVSAGTMLGGLVFGGCVANAVEADISGYYALVDGGYYQYDASREGMKLADVIWKVDGTPHSYAEIGYACRYETTRPAAGIANCFYYIADENSVMLYDTENGKWETFSSSPTVISDESQITVNGVYALVVDGEPWLKFIVKNDIKTTEITVISNEETQIIEPGATYITKVTVEPAPKCTEPHFITVDELPTENIDETAVYKCGGKLYQYKIDYNSTKGTWLFNSWIDMEFCFYYDNNLENSDSYVTHVDVPFKSNGKEFTGMDMQPHMQYCSYGILTYCGDESVEVFTFDYDGNTDWASGEEYRTVEFSEDYENEGYLNYLNTNAKKTSGEWLEYVQPSGEITLTSNGSHDVSGKKTAVVDVPIPEGYIKPSGTLEITEHGTYDVTNYASVDVYGTYELKPLTVTKNGVYENPDVDGYDKVTVNVENGGIEGGYTVTFMSDGAPHAIISVTEGQAVIAPTEPTSEGLCFNGWYTDETYSEKIEFPYTPTENTTLYALLENLAGTWYFNDTINLPNETLFAEINFTSNTASYTAIKADSSYVQYRTASGGYTIIYPNGSYYSTSKLRTIEISEVVSATADFITWFKANATYQG